MTGKTRAWVMTYKLKVILVVLGVLVLGGTGGGIAYHEVITPGPVVQTTSSGSTQTPAGYSIPAVPSDEQICGSTGLQSPYNYTGGATTFTSGQFGLPTYGSALTNFPNATAGIIVTPSSNVTASQLGSNTVYYFEPGTYLDGAESYSSIVASTGTVLVGGYSGGTGVTLNGQGTANISINLPGNGIANNVTVEYFTMTDFSGGANGVVNEGSSNLSTGWVVEHNTIGPNSTAGVGGGNNPSSTGFYGGNGATVDYNCFTQNGLQGANIFGTGADIEYNEFYDNANQPDVNSCGCDGTLKFWETTNSTFAHNWVHGDEYDVSVWYDTDNTGMLISNNYISYSYQRALQLEISYNADITGNIFLADGWGAGVAQSGENLYGSAIAINASGGINNGSNYNNEILIQDNTIIDSWDGIWLWGEGDRSCLNSGEGPADYCSGDNQLLFSHYANPTNTAQGGSGYEGPTLAAGVTNGATTLTSGAPVAVGDQVGFAAPTTATTSDTTAVTSFTGSGTINATTTGFPSSCPVVSACELQVATSTGAYTGALLSYAGVTGTTFTGVSLIYGSGNLSGAITQAPPYKVTADTYNSGTGVYDVTVATGVPTESSGTFIYTAGTCWLYATGAATPSSPDPPSGSTSYWDGCQWETKNIQVSSNDVEFSATDIQNGYSWSAFPWSGLSLSDCYSGPNYTTLSSPDNAEGCGVNGQQFDIAGQAPFSQSIGANAMMSDSSFTGNLANLNAIGSPPGTTTNSEAPWDDVWSGNTYSADQTFIAYNFGSCESFAPEPCVVNQANWTADWQQG